LIAFGEKRRARNEQEKEDEKNIVKSQ